MRGATTTPAARRSCRLGPRLDPGRWSGRVRSLRRRSGRDRAASGRRGAAMSTRRDGSESPASSTAPRPPLSSRMWPEVGGEAVGDVDHGVDRDEPMACARASRIAGSGRRCRPSRLPPSGPVTRIASPGLGARRRTAPRSVASPSTVTLITSGPSQALVSPPTRSTPNRSASGSHAGVEPLRHSAASRAARRRPRRPRAERRPSRRCPTG